MIEQLQDQQLKLKRIYVKSDLPQDLKPLRELANNLWWSWQKAGIDLFKEIAGEDRWEAMRYNPIAILDEINTDKANELVANPDFMQRLDGLYQKFQAYKTAEPQQNTPKIAYFCMEYGLHISAKLYSGGLGILAGDFLKEASDMNVSMVAVGFLYRYGYFEQGISIYGDQINNYPPQTFTKMPLEPVWDAKGEWLKVSVNFPGRVVFARVWKLMVGRIPLYLLDTDFEDNSWEDRALTHQLYGGDNEHRLKQEILLGIGGLRAIDAIGVDADVYHCNEGHAAFQPLERLKNYVKRYGITFEEAVEVVRSSSLFTTHTPVPAGHDYFSEDLLRRYLWDYIQDLGIEWSKFIGFGKVDTNNPRELFSMSHLATRLSQEVNGVSKLHGTVSQKMFSVLYPGYNWEENHISYVTNSVHYPTWIANEWHKVFAKAHGDQFLPNQSDPNFWRIVHQLPNEQIHAVRQGLKAKLMAYVKATIQKDLTHRGESPRLIFDVLNNIPENAFVLGFARRFATYKRAQLLFSNLDRLRELVNDPAHPVMFLFAGKAHPADKGGQAFIRDIVQISKRPEFIGKIIFLENYNMEMAKLMVQGVDVWLNTPTRPKEASGTSGMKAAMNGVVNFSVLDGWWAEGYRPDAGWSLPLENTYDDERLQNDLDAETIYYLLETELIPAFFDRNEAGISEKWLSYVKNIMSDVAPHFTMKRMMDDYMARFYNKLMHRGSEMRQHDFAAAKDYALWKRQMRLHWNRLQVTDVEVIDTTNQSILVGSSFSPVIKLDLNGVPAANIGVEAVFFKRITERELELKEVYELPLRSLESSVATYSIDLPMKMAGVYEYGFRIFPKHRLMPHRQDIELVRWI